MKFNIQFMNPIYQVPFHDEKELFLVFLNLIIGKNRIILTLLNFRLTVDWSILNEKR